MPRLNFITSNDQKFEIVASLSPEGLEITKQDLEVPEIQADSSLEVARFSAHWAANRLGVDVLVSDVSYHIESLGGFPGPYIKDINKMLKPEQVIAMVGSTTLRGLLIVESYVIAEANPSNTMEAQFKERASICDKIGETGTTFDRIVVREGHDIPQSEMTDADISDLFSQNMHRAEILGKLFKQYLRRKF